MLVGERETCKVTDFGMARDVQLDNIYERKTKARDKMKGQVPEICLFKNIRLRTPLDQIKIISPHFRVTLLHSLLFDNFNYISCQDFVMPLSTSSNANNSKSLQPVLSYKFLRLIAGTIRGAGETS